MELQDLLVLVDHQVQLVLADVEEDHLDHLDRRVSLVLLVHLVQLDLAYVAHQDP